MTKGARSPDPLSRLLGIELVEDGPGWARLRARVGKDHRNFLGSAHGGFVFALADTALAVASNRDGPEALALAASIHFLRPVAVGDLLEAEAREISLERRTATYEVVVAAAGEPVALFTGTVYRRSNR